MAVVESRRAAHVLAVSIPEHLEEPFAERPLPEMLTAFVGQLPISSVSPLLGHVVFRSGVVITSMSIGDVPTTRFDTHSPMPRQSFTDA